LAHREAVSRQSSRLTLAEFEASDRGRQLREPFAGALREAEAEADADA
jgi:hypothetical protein